MKRLFLFVFLFVSITGYAQKLLSGSFVLPESEKYIEVDWDCSKTVFDKKYNETEWKSIIGEKDWNNAKSEALAFILNKMNDEMKKSRLIAVKSGENLQSSYVLYISPLTLDKKGNNVTLYILKEKKTGAELGRLRKKGDGGHWGTLANLLGDGYEEAASDIGGYIKKHNKVKK